MRGAGRRVLGEVRHLRRHELQLHGHPAVRSRPTWRSRWPAARTASRPSGPCPATTRTIPACALTRTPPSARTCSAATSRPAFFGSVDFDIIPKVLTLTGGTRYYQYDEFEEGSEYYSATSSVLNVPNGTGTSDQPCGFGMNLQQERERLQEPRQPDLAHHAGHHGVLHLLAGLPSGRLQPHQDDRWMASSMLKAVRPITLGGAEAVLQAGGLRLGQPDQQRDRLQERVVGPPRCRSTCPPTRWTGRTCSCRCSTRCTSATRPSTSTARATTSRASSCSCRARDRGLTVQGSSSWNSSSQTNAPCLTSNVPAPSGQPDAGRPVHHAGQRSAVHQSVRRAGHARRRSRRAACSTLRARYDWTIGRLQAVRDGVGMNHIGSMSNQPASFPDGNDPAQNPSDHDAARTRCRATRPTMRRSAWPRTTGRCSSRAPTWATRTPVRIHQLGPVHQVGGAAAAAGDHAAVRLQVLSRAADPATGAGRLQ